MNVLLTAGDIVVKYPPLVPITIRIPPSVKSKMPAGRFASRFKEKFHRLPHTFMAAESEGKGH